MINNSLSQLIRRDLAILYRIVSYLNLDDHTYTHLSSRSELDNTYFILPFGLNFVEVTSNNLIEVGLDGIVRDKQDSNYNKTGYIIHGQIYQNRSDINCIIHVHTPEITAVSTIVDGLMPISQHALHFYNKISYHEYDSLVLDKNIQGEKLIKDLGNNNILMLRNHGVVICGKTVYESLFYLYHLQRACIIQIMTLSQNKEIVIPSHEIAEKSVKDLLTFEEDLGKRDWDSWIRILQNKNMLNI